MGHRRFAAQWLKLLAAAGLVGSALVGCSGDDGTDGPAGSSGVVIAPVQTATALTITITGAAVSSPPVVSFRMTNQNGESVTGLTDTDFRFNIAKLVPGTFGNPYNWQSYLNRVQGGAVVGTQERKATGSAWGSLVANGDGTYTYTFATDITSAAANPCPAPCTDAAGKPLDLSYQPNLTHRVGIQLNNTALPRANGTHDFVPAGGGLFRREIVRTGKCNECHNRLAAHGGGLRVETKLCVTCHNPGSWDNSPGNVQTLDFKVMVHKIHMGDELPSVVAGGTYKIGNTDFSDVAFPQDIRNCTKCHDGADPATPQGNNWQVQPSREACGSCHDNVNFATGAGHAGGIKDNSTCLACHSTGGEVGPVANSHLPTTPPSSDSSLAKLGGNANTNAAWMAGFNDHLPAGAVKITYDVKTVSTWPDPAAGNALRPRIVFKFKRDGTDLVFPNPASATELMPEFVGSPSAYFVWAIPQDGVTSPADLNVSASGYIKRIWNGTNTGTLTGPDGTGYYTLTLTGTTVPANATMFTGGIGFTYSLSVNSGTQTLSATNSQPLTQVNLPAYPYPDPKQVLSGTTTPVPGSGGLIVQTPVVWKTGVNASGTAFSARRKVVESERCFTCHAQLGIKPAFHAGQRNDAQTCNWCHRANQTSSGWSARSTSFVHSIHAAAKRTQDFNWHATSATGGYQDIRFPGILKDCDTCHSQGTYDYSGIAYTDAMLASQFYTTVATGTFSLNTNPARPETYQNVPTTGSTSYMWTVSPYITLGQNYGASVSTSTNPATTDPLNLVISPIATVCFACHDDAAPKAHMETYGASIYVARSTALAKTETCMLCHGPGKVAAIADMHAK